MRKYARIKNCAFMISRMRKFMLPYKNMSFDENCWKLKKSTKRWTNFLRKIEYSLIGLYTKYFY